MFDTMNSPNRNMAIVRAVREQKRSPSKVAKHFGISRQRVYQILNAFDAGGAQAVAPKSRAPHTHPQAVPDKLRADIVTIRRQLTRHGLDAGPETIAFHLERDGKRSPSTSTIRRILAKEGLISPEPKRSPKAHLSALKQPCPMNAGRQTSPTSS